MDYNKHWNTAYEKTEQNKLGWYEKEATPTLNLIKQTGIAKTARILNVGIGTSTIINDLLELGYSNLIVNDISEKALDLLKEQLKDNSEKLTFIQDDLSKPENLKTIEPIDLWNDRAVLHFLTEEKDIKTYFDLLKSKVKVGGYALLPEFELEGAEKCCGLFVRRYSAEMLQNELGEDYELEEKFHYDFTNPNSDIRKYIYTLFKRVK